MGFWDTGIGDLEAIGIRVGQDQRHALHEGGQVLLVQHLLSFGAAAGDDHGMFDQEGEEVFVPQILNAVAPIEAADDLESWCGAEWRTWPSYVGVLDEAVVDQRWWNDSTTYNRVWEGIPLVDPFDVDVAARIISAATRRINDSVYEQLCIVTEFEYCGETEFNLDDLLPIMELCANDPDADISDLGEFDEAEDTGYLKYVAMALKDLVDGNHISFLNHPSYGTSSSESEPCSFKPMEHYLREDREAWSVWNRLVNARENALAIITEALPQQAGALFDRYERRT